jgi:large subunit ribosomal protein L24
MENKFSTSWNASKQPRKQRKFRFNAPLHIRGRMIMSLLSKDLRKKYDVRSLRIRKGDKVKIMRGQFKGKEGKVERVDLKKYKIIIDNAEVLKKDGSKTFYPIDPSNVMIVDVNNDDKRRFAKLKSTKEEKKENKVSISSGAKSKEIKAIKKEVKKDEVKISQDQPVDAAKKLVQKKTLKKS